MQVKYKTVIHTESCNRQEYILESVDLCCKEVSEFWRNFCKFGGPHWLSKEHYHFVFVTKVSSYYDDPDFYPIYYCPMCGTPIMCVAVKVVRLVETTKEVTRVEKIKTYREINNDV